MRQQAPIVAGRPAIWDDTIPDDDILHDVLSRWRCPYCRARLAPDGTCLNACALPDAGRPATGAAMKKFGGQMPEMVDGKLTIRGVAARLGVSETEADGWLRRQRVRAAGRVGHYDSDRTFPLYRKSVIEQLAVVVALYEQRPKPNLHPQEAAARL